METKVCNQCKISKLINQFKHIKGNPISICSKCASIRKNEKRKALKDLNKSLENTIAELRDELRMATASVKKKESALRKVKAIQKTIDSNNKKADEKMLSAIKMIFSEYDPFDNYRKVIKCIDCGKFAYTHIRSCRCDDCQIVFEKKEKKRIAAEYFQNNKERVYEYRRQPEARAKACYAQKIYRKNMSEEQILSRRSYASKYAAANNDKLKLKTIELPDCIIKGRLKAEGYSDEHITKEQIEIKRCIIKIRRAGRKQNKSNHLKTE